MSFPGVVPVDTPPSARRKWSGADIISRHGVMLPADHAPGERMLLLRAGAYTRPCSTVGFNGFPPLAVQVLEDL